MLGEVFDAGARPDPAVLDGRSYRGWNRGPVMRHLTEKFVKTFRREPGGDWGHNLVVRQDKQAPQGAWELKLRDGAPVTQGHYRVTPEGHTLHLDYDVSRNRGTQLPLRVIQDDVVLVNPGDHDLLLGRANFRLGPVRFFVCFFQLEVRRE
jgi:hypothetical protein